ncbi:universal stress protein [Massilia niastensis]|uniref:universal stress protein n=1 Tax=Massilia niastensis TaxID=544911 RepID=UPI0003A62F94|nr:universal stress protein [Massilia niastensis]
MNYRTILVHADLSRAAPDRIRLAARLACTAGAHLVGSALTGISRFAPLEAPAGPALVRHCAHRRRHAAQALERFDLIAVQEGVASREARLVDDDVDGGMAVQARYCDLVVVGQVDHSVVEPELPGDLPEYLLLTCGRPVLVVPFTGCIPELRGDALVAWDGSNEATRAVVAALPLLRAARCAIIAGFGGELAHSDSGVQDCGRLATYLGRHGVASRSVQRAAGDDIGEALLGTAADLGCSLLVMGGYGHTRFRELLMKGVTRTILRAMTLPVLLVH